MFGGVVPSAAGVREGDTSTGMGAAVFLSSSNILISNWHWLWDKGRGRSQKGSEDCAGKSLTTGDGDHRDGQEGGSPAVLGS